MQPYIHVEELAQPIIRTLGMVIVVFIVLRLMGKREIGKLSVFDMVISIMLAEIAVIVIEDYDRPFFMSGVLPMGVLLGVQVGLAVIMLKSRRLRHWFDGKPTMLIEHGKLNRDNMRTQRYNLDDLMLQLREQKISDLSQVEFAILERTGKLSIILKEGVDRLERPKQPKGEEDSIKFESLPLPLIMDGKVIQANVEAIGQTMFWLRRMLKERGVMELKRVFLCTIDHRGRLFVDFR